MPFTGFAVSDWAYPIHSTVIGAGVSDPSGGLLVVMGQRPSEQHDLVDLLVGEGEARSQLFRRLRLVIEVVGHVQQGARGGDGE